MSYRPQFVFAVPAGFRDEQFHYAFSALNTPSLSGTLAAGQEVADIPLLLQSDTEFRWRGVKIASTPAGSSLKARFRDCFGNFLSDEYVPINCYAVGSGLGGYIGTVPVPLEEELVCPPGGVVWLGLQNPTAIPVSLAITVSLFGVKRVQELECAR